MPTPSSTVGPLVLPVPAGAPNSAVDDPTLTGLGAYLAFWLNADLNTKLVSLGTSRDDASTVVSAVPEGNVFCWDPRTPNATFARGKGDGETYPLPALYLWDAADKRVMWSQLYAMRERQVMAAWIFEEAELPGWQVDRYGLRAAACATLFRAIEQGWHPSYNSRATIAEQLSLAGHGILYQGSQRVMLSPIVDQVQGSDQPQVRAYPCALASYLVWEREDGQTPLPTETTPPDLLVKVGVGADPQNALPAGSRVVPAPPYTTST
jgi:hypothetical protein